MATNKVDFKIRRGLSSELFGADGLPKVKLEDGSWYLCVDTAKLYICVKEDDTLKLKLINETCSNSSGGDSVEGIVDISISEENKLAVKYSSGDIKVLDIPTVDLSEYAKLEDIPDIDDLASISYVDEKVNALNIPDVSNYITNQYLTQNYTTTEQLEATYVTQESVAEVITEQVETKVTTIIQEKVDNGELTVSKVDSVSYDTWED